MAGILPRALLFSVVFHWLILAGIEPIGLRLFAPKAGEIIPLQAQLTGAKPVRQPAPPVARVQQISSTAHRLAKPSALKKDLPAEKALILPAFSASTAASESMAKQTTMAVPATAIAENSSPQADNSLESLNPEGLRQYRLNLAREARRFKRYPSQARQRGWEGKVTVRIHILPGSSVPVVALVKGSGFDLLDSQALEMMESAVRSASIPDTLQGRSFAINAPVEFRLDE